MGIVGRLDQYASMLAGEFDDYSMSENLLTNSQLATTIQNDSNAVTLTTDTSIINPFGGYDGVLKCVHTTNTPGYFRRGKALSLTAGTTYTFSVFFKNGTVTNPYGQNNISPGPSVAANTFTPSFEEFVASLKTTIPFQNGWYRQVITFTATYNQTYNVFFNQAVNQTLLGTYYLYGFQLENGSTATDYTPTTTIAKNRVLSSTTNTNITGLSTYFSSGFSENVGAATTLAANVFPPYDLVYDDFGGTLFGAGRGRYMRQNTDKSVIVYNEIDEVSDFRDIVRTGLVLDLDAAQPLSYKGTGEIWYDLSGNGNNATRTNNGGYGGQVTYNSAGYFDFSMNSPAANGAGNGASFGNGFLMSSMIIPAIGSFTLNAFVRRDTAVKAFGDRETIFSNTADAEGWRFGIGTGGYLYYLISGAGGSGYQEGSLGGSTLANGSWHMMTAVFDRAAQLGSYTVYGYIDGVASGSVAIAAGAAVNTAFATRIPGVGYGGCCDVFAGQIANVFAYNRALTSTEITKNYNALKHRFGL